MKFFNYFFLLLFIVSCAPTPGDKTFVPKNRKEEIQHIINVAPKSVSYTHLTLPTKA